MLFYSFPLENWGKIIHERKFLAMNSNRNLFVKLLSQFVCNWIFQTHHHNPNKKKCIDSEEKNDREFVCIEVCALSLCNEWTGQHRLVNQFWKCCWISIKIISILTSIFSSISNFVSGCGFDSSGLITLSKLHINIFNNGNPEK